MPSVLLVDDDEAVRRTIARFLTAEGFEVVEASNGLEALNYLRTGAGVSVIVLDLRMPVMDGWTFRREQRLDPVLGQDSGRRAVRCGCGPVSRAGSGRGLRKIRS